MEHAKLANRNGHLPSVSRAPARRANDLKDSNGSSGETVPRKKTAPTETRLGRVLRKTTERKPRSGKLVCRYCGSDDLAPSFVKRRDRRCRKCFSNRYGSAARTKKGRIKK